MADIILRNLDKIVNIFILFGTSLIIRIALQMLGQRWIMTTAHTGTLVLLPILTYVITSVISGNIALSLGMVGALSIVRFRHPVRSPLELSVYFGAITLGIAASVNLKWVLFLTSSVIIAAVILVIINYIATKFFNKIFFTTSFSEGASLSTLNVTARKPIGVLERSTYLISKRYSQEDTSYTLAAMHFNELVVCTQGMSEDPNVVSFQLNR
jgi:hypothetical protein